MMMMMMMMMASENIRDNMNASATENLAYYVKKEHKPWFDEECSELLDQRKQAKFQLLQNPSQTNEENMNNLRCENTITFRGKRREYLKEKINELEANIKNENIRGIYREA
jgi:hypothetical protein